MRLKLNQRRYQETNSQITLMEENSWQRSIFCRAEVSLKKQVCLFLSGNYVLSNIN